MDKSFLSIIVLLFSLFLPLKWSIAFFSFFSFFSSFSSFSLISLSFFSFDEFSFKILDLSWEMDWFLLSSNIALPSILLSCFIKLKGKKLNLPLYLTFNNSASSFCFFMTSSKYFCIGNFICCEVGIKNKYCDFKGSILCSISSFEILFLFILFCINAITKEKVVLIMTLKGLFISFDSFINLSVWFTKPKQLKNLFFLNGL